MPEDLNEENLEAICADIKSRATREGVRITMTPTHAYINRLRFSKNETRERCACCGALPELYHSQLCADQNAMKMTEADSDQAISLYDSKQKFVGFAILPEGQSVRSRVADNAYSTTREAAIKLFVERLESAAAEVIEGPIAAMTENGTRFQKLGLCGWEQEGQIPCIIHANEGDAKIDELLSNLADGIIHKYLATPTRLVWRKRPELRMDGPITDAEAVRWGVSPRDHAVIWLYARLAFEPAGFV